MISFATYFPTSYMRMLCDPMTKVLLQLRCFSSTHQACYLIRKTCWCHAVPEELVLPFVCYVVNLLSALFKKKSACTCQYFWVFWSCVDWPKNFWICLSLLFKDRNCSIFLVFWNLTCLQWGLRESCQRPSRCLRNLAKASRD